MREADFLAQWGHRYPKNVRHAAISAMPIDPSFLATLEPPFQFSWSASVLASYLMYALETGQGIGGIRDFCHTLGKISHKMDFQPGKV